MGSALSRYLRDLEDLGGFESVSAEKLDPEPLPLPGPGMASSSSSPSTPVRISPLDLDPRSPTAEIVRTPIELSSKLAQRISQESPLINALHSRKSYLETDLDTLATSETMGKPEASQEEQGSCQPPGLSSTHLMKLRFLGIDPRSPSSDVVRTPIQLGKGDQRGISPIHFDDTLSVGSLSSQDLFNNSMCSSEFTRDCSDPSAIVSEIDDMSDKEEDCVLDKSLKSPLESSNDRVQEDSNKQPMTSLKEDTPIIDELPKTASKLQVFREDHNQVELDAKASPVTPDRTKKSAGRRARTPLTPICNRNRTPNSILRAKQSQTIEKEILTKAKIYSMDENVLTPSKVQSMSNKRENASNTRPIRKQIASNDENAPISGSKKKILAQWDQDNSVII